MEQQTIRERIRKLLALTQANGCTEAEAMAAAEKAARLMREHGLSGGDLAFDAEEMPSRHTCSNMRAGLWSVIGHCTNCGLIVEDGGRNSSVIYIGKEPGPQIAGYLHAVTNRAIDREIREFRKTGWYRKRRTQKAKRAATSDFTEAMIHRLSSRLLAIFGPTRSSQALEAARAELDRRYPRTKTVTPKGGAGRYWEAMDAGRGAAESVSLNHGVSGHADAPRLLGGAQ